MNLIKKVYKNHKKHILRHVFLGILGCLCTAAGVRVLQKLLDGLASGSAPFWLLGIYAVLLLEPYIGAYLDNHPDQNLRHGIYFQWYSAWGEGADGGYYRAGILTAPSINGPWTKSPQGPIIKTNEEYTGCGHNHSFRGLDGKDYVVFHALCLLDSPDDQKERMYIREVEYQPDGTVLLK